MNKDYDDLSTWDFWSMEDELRNVLEAKGYGLINFDLTYNPQGHLSPCIEVYTSVAESLANEIKKHGFLVSVMVRPDKRSFSYVFIKNHYPVELLNVVDSFEVVV